MTKFIHSICYYHEITDNKEDYCIEREGGNRLDIGFSKSIVEIHHWEPRFFRILPPGFLPLRFANVDCFLH